MFLMLHNYLYTDYKLNKDSIMKHSVSGYAEAKLTDMLDLLWYIRKGSYAAYALQISIFWH